MNIAFMHINICNFSPYTSKPTSSSKEPRVTPKMIMKILKYKIK